MSEHEKCYLVKGRFTSESRSPWIYASLHNLMGLKYEVVSVYDDDILSVINIIDREDIVFFADSFFFNLTKYEAEKILSSIDCYKISISFDDEYLIDWTLYFGKYVNLIITFDGVCHEYLSQIGVESILCPHPFPVYPYEYTGEYEYDVSFVGTVGNKYGRRSFLKQISEIYPNSFISGLHGEFITREEMLEIFKKSRINLNFTGISDAESGLILPYMNKRRGFKGRPFEIGSVGGFCMSEFSPSLAKFLANKHNIVYFNNVNQAINLIGYYLKNNDERLKIAENLAMDVRNKYSDSSVENVLLKNIELCYERWKRGKLESLDLGKEDVFVAGWEFARLRYLLNNRYFKKSLHVYLSVARKNFILFIKINIKLITAVYKKIRRMSDTH